MLGVGRVIDGSVDCWWLPQAKGDVRVEMKLKGEDQVRTGKRKLMECALSRRERQASIVGSPDRKRNCERDLGGKDRQLSRG